VVELRPANGKRPLGSIEAAQGVGKSVSAGVTADKRQVVRLVLVGNASALVAFTMPDLNMHRTCEPQHAEVRLDLIEIENNTYVPVSDQIFEFPTAPREGHREAAHVQHPIAGVRPIDDHEDRTLLGQMLQR
jgi:hypothetical protein